MAAQENHVDVVRCLLLNSANQTLATEVRRKSPGIRALLQLYDSITIELQLDSCTPTVQPAMRAVAATSDDSFV